MALHLGMTLEPLKTFLGMSYNTSTLLVAVPVASCRACRVASAPCLP